MRKRYYILFVSRDAEGELLKVPIPLHYLYMFLVGAVIGMLTITGMAGSYTRMLLKTQHFNELRSEKEALKKNYTTLERVAQEKEIQVASMSTLASEVSALYGLKNDQPIKLAALDETGQDRFASSLDQFYTLRTSAMTGAATAGIDFGTTHSLTTADWARLAAAPALWPVEGRVTASFGERVDPFSGEGAFHTGIDIASDFGTAVVAPADGVIEFSGTMNGYGRTIQIEHGHNISTRYAHLSGFAVTPGQRIHKGDTIGYVGLSGRSTGPHLHYEVRIGGTPVNPHKYLRYSPTHIVTVASGM